MLGTVRTWLAIALLSTAVAIGCGDSKPDSAEASSSGGKEPPPVNPYTYKAGNDGLRDLMQNLLNAVAAGDRPTARVLARSLEIEDYEAWFGEYFGTELSPSLATEYKEFAGRLPQLVSLLSALRKDGHTAISVEQFDSPDDPAAAEYQSLALKRMIRATPLYSVRISNKDGTKTFHLWSFVYHDGLFRWIGKTKSLAGEPIQGEDDLREFRIRDRKAARDIPTEGGKTGSPKNSKPDSKKGGNKSGKKGGKKRR